MIPGPRPARLLTEFQVKRSIARDLAHRFFLRFHVAIILLWTFLAGLLTTKLLLWVGSESMLVRYPLAIIVSYLAFLLGVRIWLEYVELGRFLRRKERHDWDVPSDFPTGLGRSSARTAEHFEPGGGEFGGGGASASFEVDAAALPADTGGATVAESTSGLAGTASEALGQAGAAAGEGCLPVLIGALILAALSLVVGMAAFIVAETPAILVEAAFEALLAGGLIRAARRMDDADWVGAVYRATRFPLLIALIAAFAVAAGAAHYKPGARTIFDALIFTTTR